MWLSAPNINCTHGFSTRHGGVSASPFDTLNLGGSQDDPKNIALNRTLALNQLKLPPDNLCTLKQVHGVTVCPAQLGAQEGDALITSNKNLVLAISIADCYPVLFYDELNGVIAGAHAGWRGTAGKIVVNVIEAMQNLGAQTQHIRVAIGQGISRNKFEVGDEVISRFRDEGFPEHCFTSNKIDLVQCNLYLLLQNNILDKNIWAMNRCTYEQDFFSYRRDNGVTGRMWGIISMRP